MPQHSQSVFFDAFDAALAGEVAALQPWLAGANTQGLAVYRNTLTRGAIDALAGTFPTVQLMTGEDWFRAAAREFVRMNPPREPALIAYGEDFPAWLAAFPPAADAPYLTGAALLDWLWWQSWSAGDAALLDAAALAAIPPEVLAHITLALHPTLRLATFDTCVPSLWLAHQSPLRGEAVQLGAAPESIAFLRTGAHVESHLVNAATHAFLLELASRRSVLVAAEAALAIDPEFSLPHILTGGIALGLFTAIMPALDTSP